MLDALADELNHAVAGPAIAKLHVADCLIHRRLGQGGKIVFGKVQHQVLGKSDDGHVNHAPALLGEPFRLRHGLAGNFRVQSFQLSELFFQRRAPLGKALDLPGQPAPSQ